MTITDNIEWPHRCVKAGRYGPLLSDLVQTLDETPSFALRPLRMRDGVPIQKRKPQPPFDVWRWLASLYPLCRMFFRTMARLQWTVAVNRAIMKMIQ